MNQNGITGLLLAVTIGAIFFVPVVDVLDSSTGQVEVENDTVTTDMNTSVAYDLQGLSVVQDSETVEVNDDGSWTTLTAGTDYTINNEAGDIQFSDTTAVSTGDEVRASYTYQATEGIVTSIADLLPLFLALLLLVPLANKVQSEV